MRRVRALRWCRGSLPIPGLNLLELTLDDPIDTHRLFVEVFETSSKPHPRLFFSFQASLELLRDGFGYKGAQRDATLGGHRFGTAEDRVGNLESRLHPSMVPYLWDLVNHALTWSIMLF